MRRTQYAGDGPGGTGAGAQGTAAALVGVDHILQQGLADTGGAAFVHHMGYIFLTEMLQSGQNRVGGGLTQSAQGAALQVVAQLLDGVQISKGALTLGDLIQQVIQTLGSDAAGDALAAALGMAHLQKCVGHIHGAKAGRAACDPPLHITVDLLNHGLGLTGNFYFQSAHILSSLSVLV